MRRLKQRNLTVIGELTRDPIWLKKGSFSPMDSACALVIPLPFEDCKVQYQEQGDPDKQTDVAWGGTIFLPPNSALILSSGSIKFMIHILRVKRSQ